MSFRSAPALLRFVNDLFGDIAAPGAGSARPDGFRYSDEDRFPIESTDPSDDVPLGIVAGESVAATAEAVAGEIVRLLGAVTVRDKTTGLARAARPADFAILFRSRESHREFEAALDRRGVPTYVYKGLGFFEADEIQDAVALLRYLADPTSDLRAAAFL